MPEIARFYGISRPTKSCRRNRKLEQTIANVQAIIAAVPAKKQAIMRKYL